MATRLAGSLIGCKIVGARYLTEKEQEELSWYECTVVLVLNDGTLLWPSRDTEGNGPGVLFGVHSNGHEFLITKPEEV